MGETLGLLASAQYVSATKRLNERMRDLERKGLTDTISYQRLSEWVASVPNRVDKTGRVRAVQSATGVTPDQLKLTRRVSKSRVSAGAELSRAKRHIEKQGKIPTREEITQQANEYGQLEEYIRSNLEKLYGEFAQTDTFLTQNEKDDFIAIMKNDMLSIDVKQNEFDEWLAQF